MPPLYGAYSNRLDMLPSERAAINYLSRLQTGSALGYTRRRGGSSMGKYPYKGVSTKTKSKSLKKKWFKYHISAFPQHEFETIRYTYAPTVNQSLLTTVYAELPIVMNGPFDPDATAGQPAGWSKLMAVYTKCFVRAAKIRVDFQNVINGGVYANLMVGITITTNSTTLASVAGATQPGLEVHAPLGNAVDTKTLEIDVDIRKFLGIKNGQDGSTSFCCTTASNPAQIVVAHVWFYNSYGATALYNFCATVDFDCDFFDPVPVT